MDFLEYRQEFRSKEKIALVAKRITYYCQNIAGEKPIRIMEVCGGHTISIFKYGLRSLLPPRLQLISGPGCPVCVTPISAIDGIIEFAKKENFIIAAFGDLLRIPGSQLSLQKVRAMGGSVHAIYSPLEALELAHNFPHKNILLPAIGFETTMPTIAATILAAQQQAVNNFYIFSAGKTMPAVMRLLCEDTDMQIDGFLCPGHVALTTGAQLFHFLAQEYHKPCAVAGFEPLDILLSLEMLLRQLKEKQAQVEIQYTRAVTWQGNTKAQALMEKVFAPCASLWRGIGNIDESGLCLRAEFASFDAQKNFSLSPVAVKENPACICGDVMRGKKTPPDCRLFGKGCLPQNPQGSCMVSDEGTCATYFKYT